MPLTYRRPGVYLEESLLVNPAEVSGAVTVACFVGAAAQGPIDEPTLVESWSDYVTLFGGFGSFKVPTKPDALSYLPFSVYSFFQNGGRTAYIIRSVPTADVDNGDKAKIEVTGTITLPDMTAFFINARSVGTWGNDLQYQLSVQNPGAEVTKAFTLQVLKKVSAEGTGTWEVVETFPNLSMKGEMPGTRRVDSAVNDAFSGSAYVTITEVQEAQQPVATSSAVSLAGGVDPDLPDASELTNSAKLVTKLEGPIALNIVGYLPDVSKIDSSAGSSAFVGVAMRADAVAPDRQDIFVINDNAPPRYPGQASSSYMTTLMGSTALGSNPGDSYSAAYGPWIVVPHPQRTGTTIAIPPGGAVAGIMARVDATVGVFRAPAGVIAGIANAVGVQTKFTDTELGNMNNANINMIRSVVGAGIAVMGGRTRKSYGADRYVSPRRTLIYIKEVLKRSTQFAVFENNDARLWSALRMSADRILRPLWEAGGLRGGNPSEAYFIRCDETINTIANISAGEVRMEVGVALEYPAEFIIIRVTQFDRATFTSEVQPIA